MSHQPNIDRIAGKVSGELSGAGYRGVGFDPTIIVTIIMAIFEMFRNCNLSPAQAEKRAARPRLLDRFRLRALIRQHSSGDEEAIEAALLDAGEELTSADVAGIYSELP